MGTIQGFCASSQAKAIWAGVAPFSWAMLLEQVDHRPVGLDGFLREAGIAAADVGAVEGGGLVDLAGQVAAAEGAVGHQADAKFLAGEQDRRLDGAPPDRIFALQGGDGLNRVGTADGGGIGFRQAEVLDLTRADQVLHCTGHIFDGHVGVGAVLVEEVDGLHAQALE